MFDNLILNFDNKKELSTNDLQIIKEKMILSSKSKVKLFRWFYRANSFDLNQLIPTFYINLPSLKSLVYNAISDVASTYSSSMSKSILLNAFSFSSFDLTINNIIHIMKNTSIFIPTEGVKLYRVFDYLINPFSYFNFKFITLSSFVESLYNFFYLQANEIPMYNVFSNRKVFDILNNNNELNINISIRNPFPTSFYYAPYNKIKSMLHDSSFYRRHRKQLKRHKFWLLYSSNFKKNKKKNETISKSNNYFKKKRSYFINFLVKLKKLNSFRNDSGNVIFDKSNNSKYNYSIYQDKIFVRNKKMILPLILNTKLSKKFNTNYNQLFLKTRFLYKNLFRNKASTYVRLNNLRFLLKHRLKKVKRNKVQKNNLFTHKLSTLYNKNKVVRILTQTDDLNLINLVNNFILINGSYENKKTFFYFWTTNNKISFFNFLTFFKLNRINFFKINKDTINIFLIFFNQIQLFNRATQMILKLKNDRIKSVFTNLKQVLIKSKKKKLIKTLRKSYSNYLTWRFYRIGSKKKHILFPYQLEFLKKKKKKKKKKQSLYSLSKLNSPICPLS